MANKQVANLNKEGMLSLNGEINERYPINIGNLRHNIIFDRESEIDNVKGKIPVDSDSTSINMANTLKVQESFNLLDSVEFDWRDPKNWYGASSNVIYNEEYDCLEIKSPRNLYANKTVPLFTNKKFNISFEVHQVSRSAGTLIYVGGRLFGQGGNVRPSSEHTPGSWDYTGISSTKLQPNDNWKTYTNHLIGGVPRSGVGTGNTQWKTDNGRFYQPLILANYSGGTNDVLRIRNIRIWYSDNKIDTKEHFTGFSKQYVNGSYTNIYGNEPNVTPNTLQSGWGGNSAIKQPIIMPDGTKGLSAKILGNGDGGVDFHSRWVDVKPNTTYTMTLLARTNDWTKIHPNFMLVRNFQGSSTQLSVTGHFSNNNKVYLSDGWYICHATFTTHVNANKLRTQHYMYNEGMSVELGSISIYEGKRVHLLPYNKTLTTPYRSVFRCHNLTTFTILGKFINAAPMVDGQSDSLKTHSILASLQSKNGFVHLRHYLPTADHNNVPFLDPDVNSDWNEVDTASRHRHFSLNLKAGQLVYWTLRFNNSTRQLNVVFFDENGNILSNATMQATANVVNLHNIILGNDTNPWEGQHLSMQVFSDHVSLENIKHLIKSKINVADGELIENISERLEHKELPLLDLPKRKNEYGEGYQTGGTKLSICPSDTSQWSFPNRPNIDRTIITPYGKGIKFMSGSTNWETSGSNSRAYMYDDNGSFTLDDYVCYSAWVYVSKDCTLDSVRLTLERGITATAYYDMTKKGQWQFLQIKAKVTTAGTLRNLLYLYNSHHQTNFDGYAIYSDINLSKTTFAQGSAPTTQFQNLAVNERSLQLNLNENNNMDWSKDWTIQYWKKPLGSNHNDYKDYCIDSLGYSGNTVGGGYLWWGKPRDKNEVSGGGTFNPNEFWNHWRLITLTHDSANNRLYIYEQNRFKTHKRVEAIGITKSNYYLSQHNYDLMLGGWQNTNVCVAEYKDIRMSQHLLTESEIYDCFKQGMSQKDVLTLNGELIENTL